jgi:D-alanyl-D-alanine carboxypeptidase
MKLTFILCISAILLFSCEKSENLQPDFSDCSFNFIDSSSTHPSNAEYQALLEDIVSQGLVGLSMAVYHDDDGLWNGAAGMADLHNRIDMQPCNITRVGSTVKMFTASTILLMVEEGDFDLDDRVSDYLSGEMIDKIENANTATIRQLLQHSSGIYNYIQNLQFQTASINDLIREWHAEDLLEYAYDKPAYFAPGIDVRYSNTGYILLGLLIEKIEGKPFYQVFQEKIFDPLQLTMTRFAAGDPVPRWYCSRLHRFVQQSSGNRKHLLQRLGLLHSRRRADLNTLRPYKILSLVDEW